jgi:uncharacterized YccA/Bax inhibitor family protein
MTNPILTRAFENDGVTRGVSAGNTYGNFVVPGSRVIEQPSNVMTIQGTVNKSAILLGLATASACVSLYMAVNQNPLAGPLWVGGMIVALVLGIVLCFSPKAAPFLAPAYAVAKGLAIGGFSAWIASQGKAGKGFDFGLIAVAMLLTFGVFAGLLAAYSFRFIRVGPTMMKMVFAGTLGVAMIGLVTLGLSLFGVNVSWLWKLYAVDGSGGLLGIGFSIFCIGLAAFNLVISFQVIEDGARMGAPKYMEWYGAYGLLVEVIWLYIEILRLLAKLRNR